MPNARPRLLHWYLRSHESSGKNGARVGVEANEIKHKQEGQFLGTFCRVSNAEAPQSIARASLNLQRGASGGRRELRNRETKRL